MKRFAFLWLFIATLACAQQAAQPTLSTVSLKIKGKTVTAEVADEPLERATGLMFRESLEPDSGMLFVMPQPERASFWMKNTLIPLQIAYINKAGVIVEIHALKPKDSTPVTSIFPNIAYALEMTSGWFDKNGIVPGEQITGLPSPPLP